ncbi:MAG: hypothetical protein PHE55_05015 [Methylococcaceae bacterium]|nr:hypothetical protein [Methylococcaceae bacterium]
MVRSKRLSSACLLGSMLIPVSASALVVEIQGQRLEPQLVGASCIEIAGVYPGLKIEASEAGSTPRICYNNSSQINSITILNATFVALDPIKKDIWLKFEHSFPAGINGKVMARAKLQGFFSTANGVGVPNGSQLSFTAYFSQTGHDDTIAEPYHLSLSDDLDSAVFEYSAKEQYLIAGPRELKGALKVYFTRAGQKLTVNDRNTISIDSGSTLADKLDTMAVPESLEENAPVGPPSPSALPATAPDTPASPIPFPAPTGNEETPTPNSQ